MYYPLSIFKFPSAHSSNFPLLFEQAMVESSFKHEQKGQLILMIEGFGKRGVCQISKLCYLTIV